MLPAERLNTLEAMLKYRKSFEIGRQPSLPQYCRGLIHRSDMVVEVRIGAKEVLELMERRAGTQSLLRPAEPVLETATLLRPASNDPYATPTEQLLRVAEDENEPGTNNDKNAGP